MGRGRGVRRRRRGLTSFAASTGVRVLAPRLLLLAPSFDGAYGRGEWAATGATPLRRSGRTATSVMTETHRKGCSGQRGSMGRQIRNSRVGEWVVPEGSSTFGSRSCSEKGPGLVQGGVGWDCGQG